MPARRCACPLRAETEVSHLKNGPLVVGFLACFIVGVIVGRLIATPTLHDSIVEMREAQSELVEKYGPMQEATRVAELGATIDTFYLVEAHDADAFVDDAKVNAYSEALIIRMEEVRQTLNLTGKYSNEYQVNQLFDRANAMLSEMGVDKQFAPYGD